MLVEVGILRGDDGAFQIRRDAFVGHPLLLDVRVGIGLARYGQLLAHKAGGAGIVVDPPPDLQEEVQLHHQHQRDGDDEQPLDPRPAAGLARLAHTPVRIWASTGAVSGWTPRHTEKASAACSTSMPRPSRVNAPWSAANCMNTVGSAPYIMSSASVPHSNTDAGTGGRSASRLAEVALMTMSNTPAMSS